jgi:serine/threonine-protein kinase
VIPNVPRTRLLTALVCASTWPAAYALNVHLGKLAPLPLNQLVLWIHMPYLMACVNFALSKRMFRMENAVHRAREVGSYHLISQIGTGGMGEVWRARHRLLARDAAIKIIRSDLLMLHPGYQSDITRRRFAREAQAIATLQSPHTVYLYDFGLSEDGSSYYVMELLDGISLQMLVDTFGPQPAARVVHVLKQVCESLEEAHQCGLIHRDVKPNNIFACAVGLKHDFVKVLDFGLVKRVAAPGDLLLTAKGMTAGTPAYMSPEVAMGDSVIDGRTDIYSLGCVAYFMLTGSLVFERKTATAMTLAHVEATPIPPSRRSEIAIPEQLEEIVLRCLAKTPEGRPQSAAELGRLLESITGVPEWTEEMASEWWRAHMPSSCSHRAARQFRTVHRLSAALVGQ